MKYKEFRVGDVFTVEPTNKFTIKGKSYVMDKDIISENGKIPYIAAISSNNGITGYSKYDANNEGNCITLSTTADSSNTVFYQEEPFIGRQQIAAIRRKDKKPITTNEGLYLVSIIRKLTKYFNYSHKLTKDYLLNSIINLPVKTVYNPDFTQLEHLFVRGGVSICLKLILPHGRSLNLVTS